MLRKRPEVVRRLIRDVRERSWLQVLPLDDGFLPWLDRFLGRFADREPQVADAALVFIAERTNRLTVFTLDRADFCVFRLNDGRPLVLYPTSLES